MKLMEVFFEPFSISLIVWLADVCGLIVPLSSQNAELELVVSVVVSAEPMVGDKILCFLILRCERLQFSRNKRDRDVVFQLGRA